MGRQNDVLPGANALQTVDQLQQQCTASQHACRQRKPGLLQHASVAKSGVVSDVNALQTINQLQPS